MVGTWLPETCREGKQNIHEKIVRQVGYLQGTYEDAESTKHKIFWLSSLVLVQ